MGKLYPLHERRTKNPAETTGNRYEIEILMSRTQKLKGLVTASLKLRTLNDNPYSIQMKTLIRIIILCLVSFIYVGCAPEPINPNIPVGLLTKSRDYLFFCISLMDTAKPLYNQIATKYYYAMFSVARVASIWKHQHFHGELETHKDVWDVAHHDARNIFGEDLKEVRTKCDYQYDINNSESEQIKKELQPIVLDDNAFNKLLDDANAAIEKYYKSNRCSSNHMNECIGIMKEISKYRDAVKSKFTI